MSSGIYRIYCKSEDKSYIGKSKNIEGRWKSHLNCLKNGNHCNKKLQKAFNKYGEYSFEFSILKELNEYYLANQHEIDYYESYYAEQFNSFKNGYNVGYLHKSKDVKYVLDNLEYLTNKWLNKLKENTKRINKKTWTVYISLEELTKYLNLTKEQIMIFMKYFDIDEYNCRTDFFNEGKLQVGYFNREYLDSLLENMYL